MNQQQSAALPQAPSIDVSAASFSPTAAAELFNKGVLHLRNGRRGDAQAIFRSAAALLPDFGWAYLALGQLAVEDGRLSVAGDALATALRCGRMEAINWLIRLASQRCRAGYPADAERTLGAVRGFPLSEEEAATLGGLLADIGATWHLHGQLHRAACLMRNALTLTPSDSRIHANLGASLKVQGLLGDAERACRRSLAVDPLNHSTHVNLLQTLEHQPDLSEDALFQAHVAWGRLYAGLTAHAPRPTNDPIPGRRLRVGYVALNFSGGPRRLFVTHLLDHRDQTGFETVCYSADPKEAEPSFPLRNAADHWRTTAGMGDEELVALIRADGIDILVDLDGHSNGNRLRAFAFKPAPVQISWVGYFHTTGLPAMDAIFMDEVMVPPGEEHRFVETVVRLPHSRFCYRAPDFAGPVAPPPSLKGDRITFGSFNLIAKIAPRVIRTWSRILQAVPRSRLLLKSLNLSDPMVCRRLEAAFAAEGIDPERLELRGPSSHAEMFREYGDLNIALDPFPFTGGITSCEALWMGVPIVTLPGERPVSRQTVGLLAVLGMPDLVARDEDDYVRIATELAAAPQRLTALRQELRPRMAASPLCDSAGMMRRVETAFRDLWRDWCAGASATVARPAPPPAGPAASITCQEALDRGFRHHREQRLAEAAACYRQSLAWEPGQADALQLLAVSLFRQSRTGEAFALLDRTLRLAPAHAAALSNLGNFLLETGRPAEAADAFHRVIAAQPELAAAQGGLLRALAALGRHRSVIEAGLAAAEPCPDVLKQDRMALAALFNAAIRLYQEGQPGEALQALEAVRQADPALPPLKNALLACHYAVGQRAMQGDEQEIARRHFEEALRLDPDTAMVHAALGRLDFSEHPYRATCRMVRAWELAQDDTDCYSGAWQLLNKLGDEFSSLEELSRDLERHWTYAVQIGVGNALRRAGRIAEAEAAYREAARRHPGHPFAHTRLGCLYATNGRHEEADLCFERAGHGRTQPREDAIRLSPAFLDRLPPAIEHPTAKGDGDLPDDAGAGDAELVILASGDAVYVAKFAFTLVNSIAQNCRRPVLVHLHTVNPDRQVDAEIARIRERLPSVRLRCSHERTEVERFGDERKTYFASARLLMLPQLLRAYRKPILMLDIDMLLLRDPDPIRAMIGDADIGAVGGSSLELWNEIWADALYVHPTQRSIAFFDFAARYIRHFLDAGQARWFLDQIALFVAHHRRQPEDERIRVVFLPRNIHRLDMVVLGDGSIQGGDDAFFWSVRASLPTSARQISSPQFQAYSGGA